MIEFPIATGVAEERVKAARLIRAESAPAAVTIDHSRLASGGLRIAAPRPVSGPHSPGAAASEVASSDADETASNVAVSRSDASATPRPADVTASDAGNGASPSQHISSRSRTSSSCSISLRHSRDAIFAAQLPLHALQLTAPLMASAAATAMMRASGGGGPRASGLNGQQTEDEEEHAAFASVGAGGGASPSSRTVETPQSSPGDGSTIGGSSSDDAAGVPMGAVEELPYSAVGSATPPPALAPAMEALGSSDGSNIGVINNQQQVPSAASTIAEPPSCESGVLQATGTITPPTALPHHHPTPQPRPSASSTPLPSLWHVGIDGLLEAIQDELASVIKEEVQPALRQGGDGR